MISDKLYELAFRYKQTKLWKMLWDTEIFAVEMSDGRIGYISIMGRMGEHCALAVYMGDEGFWSLADTVSASWLQTSDYSFEEGFMQQSCLQCAFEKKDELSKEECEEARRYAREHGIRISGRNAYPQFVKYQPFYFPWGLQTVQEQDLLCEALAAAIFLAGELEKKTPEDLGLYRFDEGEQKIPILKVKNGSYIFEETELPKERKKQWPEPRVMNDIGIANLKKVKRSGVWECEVIRFPQAIQEHPKDVPYYPVVLLAVEQTVNFLLPISPVLYYEDNPERLLDAFIEALLEQQICPEEIWVKDERTYALLKKLCKRLKISIAMEAELEILEPVKEDFFDHFCREQPDELEEIMDLLDDMMDLSEEELKELPDWLINQIELLVQAGKVPAVMEKKLNKIFHFRKETKGDGNVGTGRNAGKNKN